GGRRPAGEFSAGRRPPAAVRLGILASLALLLAVIGKYTAALAAGVVVVQWMLSSQPWRRERRRAAFTFGGALVLPLLLLGLAGALVAFRFTGERPVVLTPVTIWERLGD